MAENSAALKCANGSDQGDFNCVLPMIEEFVYFCKDCVIHVDAIYGELIQIVGYRASDDEAESAEIERVEKLLFERFLSRSDEVTKALARDLMLQDKE
jgi:hypothetical protein